jgi:hypothetical protein
LLLLQHFRNSIVKPHLEESKLLHSFDPYFRLIYRRIAPHYRDGCFCRTMEPIILHSSTHPTPAEPSQSQDKASHTQRPRLASFSSTRKTSISWGRRQHHGSWVHALGCASIMTFCPLLVIFYWIALSSHHGSLMAAWQELWTVGPISFFWSHAPRGDYRVHYSYAGYLVFQAALYHFLPGKLSVGQLTPAGHLLKYRINGLFAWVLTHLLFGTWVLCGCVNPAIIARHWEALLVTANLYGFALSSFSYAKAHLLPTHEGDRKLSGGFFILSIVKPELTTTRINFVRSLHGHRIQPQVWQGF